MNETARIDRESSQESPLPGWADDPLGFLIAPVTPAEFFETYYERRALLSSRREPTRHADLLTLERLDAFIASADLREGMIDLTRHQSPISRDAYVDDRGRVSSVAAA